MDIIEPLGHKAEECNSDYIEKFTTEFEELFCDGNDNIDWNKLVKFNSGKKL